jgi:hypothetical protein
MGSPMAKYGAVRGTVAKNRSNRSGSRKAWRWGSLTDKASVNENTSLSAPNDNAVA